MNIVQAPDSIKGLQGDTDTMLNYALESYARLRHRR